MTSIALDAGMAVVNLDRAIGWATTSAGPERAANGRPADDRAFIPDMVDVDFMDAPELQVIADGLIGAEAALTHLLNCRIAWLWKRKAGGGGRTAFGKPQMATGMLAHFARADVVLWLGADACQAERLTNRQLEAAVYHELLKIAFDEEKEKYELQRPDFAGFAAEIERYGAWRDGLVQAQAAFRQGALFG
ncbi:MAG: hypothetical protein IT337_15450 [Thermomicrobiales bacterium]|nr:hypothetical protein [Thermomicrobiales bacterium]